MKKDDLLQMHQFEEKYWWHVGRRYFLDKLFKNYLSNSLDCPIIVDFGCGMGGNYNFLSKYGKVIGIDNSKISIDFCQKNKQNVKLIDGLNIPFQDNSVDLITAFDSLEHIKNDEEIIEEYWRTLKENGKIFVTVPAYKFMWSDHDKVLGHYHRYTKRELKDKFESKGFKMLKASYYISFLFPLILAYRLYRIIFSRFLNQKTSYIVLPKILNSFFILIIKAESFFVNRFQLPFGCSVVAIFEKNKK